MNAYELANAILDCNEPDFNLVKDAANMLRQQADRITELEQNLSAYIVELELHKAMIQDLERKLNNV